MACCWQVIFTLAQACTPAPIFANSSSQRCWPGTGAIPIPGCKGVQQLRELAGALEFDLDDNEVAMIEERLAAL